jgi:uncharacterized RDD family membrane protein YckC
MTTLWYFVQDGAQQGPLAEEDLRRRFLRAELPKDTLVWSEGMAAWAPAERVSMLTQAPPPPPPVPAAAPAGVAVALPQGIQARALAEAAARQALEMHRPWARFGARVFDMLVFQALVLLFLPEAWKPDPTDTLQVNLFYVGVSIVSLFAWTFLEAACLARWGMTPGKWVYRLRILHPDGRSLTYGEALSRSFQVLFGGMALGLPGVPLITMALAYKELIETGATSWDRRGRFGVQHGRQRGIHRFVALLFVFLLIYGAINSLAVVSG